MIIVLIYTIIAYNCLSTLQRKAGYFYIGSISQYFMGKVVIAAFLGWVIIPIWLIMKLFGALR